MENNKVTWKEQLGAIMLIVSLGYWFRMGQRWADKVINDWKELIRQVKIWYWLKKGEKDPVSEEDEEF